MDRSRFGMRTIANLFEWWMAPFHPKCIALTLARMVMHMWVEEWTGRWSYGTTTKAIATLLDLGIARPSLGYYSSFINMIIIIIIIIVGLH